MGKITSNNLSIKEQLVANVGMLEERENVANVSFDVFKNKNMSEIRNYLFQFYSRFGFKIERQSFGTIIVDKKRINTSLNYLMTNDELAAHLTVPSVLKQGILIGMHVDHKGRNYQTLTIAAPVIIDEKRCYVAAIVKRTNKDYYKIHRVISADESMILKNIKEDGKSQ